MNGFRTAATLTVAAAVVTVGAASATSLGAGDTARAGTLAHVSRWTVEPAVEAGPACGQLLGSIAVHDRTVSAAPAWDGDGDDGIVSVNFVDRPDADESDADIVCVEID